MNKHHSQVTVNRGHVPSFNRDMLPIQLPVIEIQFHKANETTREIISESTGYRLYRELKKSLNLK